MAEKHKASLLFVRDLDLSLVWMTSAHKWLANTPSIKASGSEPDGSMCGSAAACQSNDMWLPCAATTVSPVGLPGQQASAGKITGDQYRFFHLTIFGSLSRMLYHPCVPAYLAPLMISGKLRHGWYWPLAFLLFSGKKKIGRWFFVCCIFQFSPKSSNCPSKFFDQKSKQLHLFVQEQHNARNSELCLKRPNNTQTV